MIFPYPIQFTLTAFITSFWYVTPLYTFDLPFFFPIPQDLVSLTFAVLHVVTEEGSIEPFMPNMGLKDSEPFFYGHYFPHHLYPFLGKFVFDKVPITASYTKDTA